MKSITVSPRPHECPCTHFPYPYYTLTYLYSYGFSPKSLTIAIITIIPRIRLQSSKHLRAPRNDHPRPPPTRAASPPRSGEVLSTCRRHVRAHWTAIQPSLFLSQVARGRLCASPSLAPRSRRLGGENTQVACKRSRRRRRRRRARRGICYMPIRAQAECQL